MCAVLCVCVHMYVPACDVDGDERDRESFIQDVAIAIAIAMCMRDCASCVGAAPAKRARLRVTQGWIRVEPDG